jgi:hypothetical protein
VTGLPEDLVAFATERVGSLDALELLCLMIEACDKWWDPATASRELDVSVGRARTICEHLARKNLLDIRITEDVRYRFQPGNEDLNRLARALVSEYRRRPVAVLRLMVRSAQRGVLDFAEAFRLRR